VGLDLFFDHSIPVRSAKTYIEKHKEVVSMAFFCFPYYLFYSYFSLSPHPPFIAACLLSLIFFLQNKI